MNRRAFLATTAAAAAVSIKAASAASVAPLGQTGAPTTASPPLPLGPLSGARYPDARLESMKKPKVSFGPTGFPAFAGTMAVERVATGFRWAEGPVYFPAGRYVLFSDIPNNRIMRFSEDDGHVSVYRQPSMNSNGNTIDREGRLITCEHSGRRVYRMDPKSGDIKMVVDDFVEPNGLCFSPDEKKLYICDTGFTDGPDNPSHIRVFDVDLAAGKLSNSKVFADMPKPSITDGLRCDRDGRLWCSVGWGDPNEDGVRCYTADGDLLGKIHIPETVANLCFGGQQRNRLYICGSSSLYAVYTSAQGAMKP